MFVDPRGQRFAAVLASLVLAAVVVSGDWRLLGLQAGVFAVGAFGGPAASPYGLLFRRFVAPRLGPPREREPAAPPRFAQLVGFVFAAVGTVGYLSGLTVLGLAATAVALGAAFLNAAFGFCLGCEAYLLLVRLRGRLRQPA